MKRLVLKITDPQGEDVPFIYEVDREKLKDAIIDPIDFGVEFGDLLETNKFEFAEISDEEKREASISGLLFSGDAQTREEAIAIIDKN